MRGKYQRIRDAKAKKYRESNPGSNYKSELFSPGLMKYEGGGRFTFYRVKPGTIIKFIWDIFIHGKPGLRKNKRIR